jgi:hypothetical protein
VAATRTRPHQEKKGPTLRIDLVAHFSRADLEWWERRLYTPEILRVVCAEGGRLHHPPIGMNDPREESEIEPAV